MNPVRVAVPAAVVTALLLGACGGSSSPSSASSPQTSPTAAPTAPADPTAATAQIAANWRKFFAYNTPRAQAAALLQDGATLRGALAFAANEQKLTHVKQGAKVTTVVFTSPTTANVTYQLLNGTQVLLPSASGVAVLVDGTWKVGKQSFCTLVQLGANGKTVPGC